MMLMVALAVAVAVYLLVTRGMPQLLSWLCYQKLHVHVKIGRIGILSLSLGDVVIRKRGMHVAIDSIGISSSLVNRLHNKLLVIYINDVRIQKDQIDGGDEKAPAVKATSSSSTTTTTTSAKFTMPNTLVNLSQILSLHVSNIDVVLLDNMMECLIHCSAREIRSEGSSDCRLSQIMLTLKAVTCKLLQPVHKASEQAPPCLAELFLDVDLGLTFDPKSEMQLKVVSLHLTPEITLTEGIFPLNYKKSQAHVVDARSEPDAEAERYTTNALERFEKLFPEEFNIEMTKTKVKIIATQSPKLLSCDLKGFAVNVACKEPLYDALVASGSCWLKSAHVAATVKLEELTVVSSSVRCVTLNRILTDVELNNGFLNLDVTVTSFGAVLSEEELLFWRNASPFKRMRKEPKKPSSTRIAKYNRKSLYTADLTLLLLNCDVTLLLEPRTEMLRFTEALCYVMQKLDHDGKLTNYTV